MTNEKEMDDKYAQFKRQTGVVKWYDSKKGYGFILPHDGGPDAFVHISAIEKLGLTGLHEGQVVEYELQSARKGKMAAVNLKVLK